MTQKEFKELSISETRKQSIAITNAEIWRAGYLYALSQIKPCLSARTDSDVIDEVSEIIYQKLEV